METTSALLIDSIFIPKLTGSGLYGHPPEGLAERLKERVGVVKIEDLDRAAEAIIRRRNSGSFPKFPECFEEIEKAVLWQAKPQQTSAKSRITRENYGQFAIDHCRNKGYYPVIKKCENAGQWQEWQNYFQRKKMIWHKKMMDERDEWQVPDDWPKFFDPQYLTPA